MRKGVLIFLLTTVSVLGWGQTSGEMVTIGEINLVGTEFSEPYIRRLITFKEGDRMTLEKLEKEIERSRVIAQSDSNVYLIEFEYTVEDGEAVFEVNVYDSILGFSFSAFSTGPIVVYRNLLGEGVNIGTHLGYSRQMLLFDWKRIGGGPIGFSFLAGHQIFNPFKSDYRTFSVGSTNKLYVWLGRHTRLGLLNDLYKYLGGWEKATDIGGGVGVGGFLSMNHLYLVDLYGVGFKFDAEYLYFLEDINKAHKAYLRGRFHIRPFNTNKIAFNIDSRWHWASDDLTQRGSNTLSENTGRTAWNAGLYIPIHLVKFTGGANFYLGLEPGLIIGKAGTDEFELKEPDVGVSIGPFLQVGFPASIFFSSRFIYNISERRLTFTVGFFSLPYTKQLDMDW